MNTTTTPETLAYFTFRGYHTEPMDCGVSAWVRSGNGIEIHVTRSWDNNPNPVNNSVPNLGDMEFTVAIYREDGDFVGSYVINGQGPLKTAKLLEMLLDSLETAIDLPI